MVLSFISSLLWTCIIWLTLVTISTQQYRDKIVTDGDVIFGGLFPMHEKGQNGRDCGRIKKEKGIQRMEAMLYAIDKINREKSLFPGLKIGVHILDTCSHDTYALEQSMDFIKAQLNMIGHADYQCNNGELPSRNLKPVAGVIGAASSPVSIMVANVLRLFKLLSGNSTYFKIWGLVSGNTLVDHAMAILFLSLWFIKICNLEPNLNVCAASPKEYITTYTDGPRVRQRLFNEH